MTPIEVLMTWVAAILTLMVLSFLWKENKFYRIAEHVGVGAAAGHGTLTAINSIQTSCLNPLLKGQLLLAIPLILGLMVFLRLSKNLGWASRYPMMFMTGTGIGVMLGAIMEGQIIGLLKATVADIFVGNAFLAVSALIVLVGFVTTLSYFVFTKEHTGGLGTSARIGRVFIMASFSCNWSAEMIYYLGLIVSAFMFLINVWIKQAMLGIV